MRKDKRMAAKAAREEMEQEWIRRVEVEGEEQERKDKEERDRIASEAREGGEMQAAEEEQCSFYDRFWGVDCAEVKRKMKEEEQALKRERQIQAKRSFMKKLNLVR